MSRIRSIKPEFWLSEQVAECSTNARLTFIGMWNHCDDNGVHPAKPRTLKAEIFPMDDFTSVTVGEWVEELIAVGLVIVFECDGEAYWHVTGWAKHQKIDRPSYKHPAPPKVPNSTTPRRTLDEDSSGARRAPPPGVESKGVESKGVDKATSPKAQRTSAKKASKTAIPADFSVSDRVKAWAQKNGHTQLDQHLINFKSKAIAKGYSYVDWDEAFMGAVRENWAKLSGGPNGRGNNGLDSDEIFGGGR